MFTVYTPAHTESLTYACGGGSGGIVYKLCGGETSGKSQRDDDATFGWLWFGLWLCILFSHEPHKIHPHCFLEIGRETF